jgi:hypothetical protein
MSEQYIKKVRFGTVYYKDEARTILHREDGPAVEWYSGNLEWYLNDKRHRIDGPAIEGFDGKRSWYINGVFIFRYYIGKDNNPLDRMK